MKFGGIKAMEQENGRSEKELGEKGGAEKNPLPPKGETNRGPLSDIGNLNFILDIPLEISVELGRARMMISELLQLGHGSVIELNKLAGEPLEIFANQKLIARGEVVVVNEKFGIKMTDIISPTERVKQLRS
jgi:flagellar motor switch protein FliN/FliY